MKNRFWIDAIAAALFCGCFLHSTATSVAQPNPATSHSIDLVPYKDPWASAKDRYWDIDDNLFNDFVNNIGGSQPFKYSGDQVTLTYDTSPALPYFVGHISARGLKPNFAYQLKLTGKPSGGSNTNSRGWGTYGDDVANERLGRAGRWWCDSSHSSQTNFDDTHFTNYYKNATTGSQHNMYGYLFVGDFITDEFGNADIDFTGQSSYHVTWQDKQNVSLKHSQAGTFRIGSATSPYYGYGVQLANKDIKLWYEYEAGRAQNNVQLPVGRYNCRLLITEESFHATTFYGGYWKTVLATEDFATDQNGSYVVGTNDSLLPDTNPNNDIIFSIGLPSAPSNLSATPGYGQVALSWTASSGATNYKVQRATTSDGPYTTVVTVTSPSYLDTTTQNGTPYFYVVSAVNSAGQSTPSNEATATSQAAPVPSAPNKLAANAYSSQIDLNWSASAGATSYIVQRGTTTGGPYATIASNVLGATYTDTTAQNGTTYFYVVIAVSSAGQSTPSNEASGTLGNLVATPTISPNGGTFLGSVNVTLAGATNGAQIRYTTDGSAPTSTSALYNAPFSLANSATIKAKAFANGAASAIASASFTNTRPLSLTPTADATVRDRTFANKNYGSATNLDVRTSNTSAENHDTYFKFDLSGTTGVVTAKLRICAALVGQGTISPLATTAYSVPNTSWMEKGITWNNKPARVTALGSANITTTKYLWYELDVTDYVKSEFLAGRRVVSLALHNSNYSTLVIRINSKETKANRAQLVLTN